MHRENVFFHYFSYAACISLSLAIHMHVAGILLLNSKRRSSAAQFSIVIRTEFSKLYHDVHSKNASHSSLKLSDAEFDTHNKRQT
jgi:hypothetical protein